jgi:hypothetical protein
MLLINPTCDKPACREFLNAGINALQPLRFPSADHCAKFEALSLKLPTNEWQSLTFFLDTGMVRPKDLRHAQCIRSRNYHWPLNEQTFAIVD